MVSIRQRTTLALALLAALLLVGYYSIREPPDRPSPSIMAKIESAREHLQQSLEEQNRDLRKALQAARASVQHVADATPAPDPPESKQHHSSTASTDGFAYVFYATTDAYACAALVNIQRLTHLLHSTLAIHVLAGPDVSPSYQNAIQAAGATLHISNPPPLPESAVPYYRDSLLKLRAFEMHRLAPGLTRVLVLDADQLIFKNLDELFERLPEVDLAAPRAYWIGREWIASTFMLISLSDRLWERVENAMEQNLREASTVAEQGGGGGVGEEKGVRYDMDLVNDVLGDTVMMLSGDFVCLNSHWEDWNLPAWYHAQRDLNWTTIQRVNELVRPAALRPPYDVEPGDKMKRTDEMQVDIVRADPRGRGRAEGEKSGNESESENMKQRGKGRVKRQIFKHTDLPVETPTPLPPIPAAQVALYSSSALFLDPTAATSSPYSSSPSSSPPPPLPSLANTFPPPSEPFPRFPLTHPLTLELVRLYEEGASVIHFSAVGKPWTLGAEEVRRLRPDAHPLLAEMVGLWREGAGRVCPGGVPGISGAGVEEVKVGEAGREVS